MVVVTREESPPSPPLGDEDDGWRERMHGLMGRWKDEWMVGLGGWVGGRLHGYVRIYLHGMFFGCEKFGQISFG